ncbi:MAG: hypothetical protein Q7Q71_04025 [Verrucomicrobiota bacterium JB023]|nr:hypothetical protein [Verrucomicrobiota bacterium JB023]
MKTNLLNALVSIGFITGAAAAPSVELPAEWAVPLETADGFALVDKATGQTRIMIHKPNGNLVEAGPLVTNLTDVSGLTSGWATATQEKVVLSSASNNRLAFVPIDASASSLYQPPKAGPQMALPLRENPGDPDALLIHHLYGDTAGEAMELIETPDGSPVPLDDYDNNYGPFSSLQPVVNTSTGDLMAIGIWHHFSPPRLTEFYRSGDTIFRSIKPQTVSSQATLASGIIGNDGRTCTIAFVPGEEKVHIYTHGFGGFSAGIATSNALPFPVGSIITVGTSIPNAPHGAIFIAEDGSSGVYGQVIGGTTINVISTFTPSGGQALAGILPVPNLGLTVLEGSPLDRSASDWRHLQNNGLGWQTVAKDSLSPWLPASASFATLFWYDSTPLVDPYARLLQLDIVPDWTTQGGAIPVSLQRETYGGIAQGLDNPVAITPTAPAGATYVMSSQYGENASVSALSDNLTLSTPSVSILPASDTYSSSVTVNALYDEETVQVFYRDATNGGTWSLFDEPFTVGYPTEYVFYAQDIASGSTGPIISRSYDFSVDLNEIDSDGDGVPDYVEIEKGLDPSAGPDTDFDFQSDLEELLEGTLADDHTSTIPESARNPRFIGQGFYLYAQAFNHTTGQATPFDDGGTPVDPSEMDESVVAGQREDDRPGVVLSTSDMAGLLLATGEVAPITEAPLGGQYGARIEVNNLIAEREWLILSSPDNFTLGTGVSPLPNGRETIRVLQRPSFELPTVTYSPSGTNRAGDAAQWLAAAATAWSNFQPISALTRMEPEDIAIAVLAEQAIFDSLESLPNALQSQLGVPASVEDFTLFPFRDPALTPLSRDMIETLLANGCDFSALIELLDSDARASTDIVSMANSIYARHVAVSASNPGMSLPLDALRSLLRDGAITDPASTVALTYDENGDITSSTTRANPYQTITNAEINATRTAMLDILADVASTKRPTETWTIEIQPSTTAGHSYNYSRTSNNNLVWLVDSFGERFILEQGLGLNLGTLFTVTGYTDVTAQPGFDTMEILSVDMVVIPAASDSDSNGNLLDDEWELFFFGSLGAVDAFDLHPTSGHSYLQYHLAGADPRAGDLDEDDVILAPANPTIEWDEGAGAYIICWDFPDDYVDAFEFAVISSTDLGESDPFDVSANAGSVYQIEPGRYGIQVAIAESELPANFFQIQMSLGNP